MGNCEEMCTNINLKFKGEIPVDNLENCNEESKYLSNNNINKITFLQKNIKSFIKKKKIHKSNHSSNKNTNQTGSKLVIHYHYNSKNSSSKSQNYKNNSNYKDTISSPKNKSPKNRSPKNRSPKNRSPKHRSPKNRSPKNRSPKNKSPKNRNKNILFPNKYKNENNNNKEEKNIIEMEDCKKNNNNEETVHNNGNVIPPLKPCIIDNDIFNEDPFRAGSRNNNYENDPRDAPIDNIRRKYPEIKEDQSSYIGEWKNRKRDGLGLLIWDNK
jgi:hypothetical protein